VVEHRIDEGVPEAELLLVGLTLPEVGAGRLVDDRPGQIHAASERKDLGLVEVAEGVERAGHVAEQSAVAEQKLRLVAGADHQRTVRPRHVVEDGHALAGHLVAAPAPVGVREALEVGIDLRGDVDDSRVRAEVLADEPRVRLRRGR
jgi:hypothetical protein